MTIGLQYQCIKQLPKLAWLAHIDSSVDTATVYHGSAVEVNPSFFVEGCWNGPYRDGGLESAECVFGSGAVIEKDKITFVSSASTTDFLYYAIGDDGISISNSLPFLLAFLNDRLDPSFREYVAINESIKLGYKTYIANIPTQAGGVVRLMYFNLVVSSSGIQKTEKSGEPHFHCFADYRTYLENTISTLEKNARNQGRKYPMEIFSTQSKGYDTTAINAIAAKHGLDKVFSCPEVKEKASFYTANHNNEDSDDGTEICERLGLNCVRIERRAFEKEFPEECLYYAGLHKNQDVNLKEVHEYISTVALLLTGVLGEIWYTSEAVGERRIHTIDSELQRWDLSGHGLTEVRLHTGFVHVPIPYIGARRRKEILAISDSEEMEPWRIGGTYDRPIARRLGEDAGIPRKLFGQKKMATVVDFQIPGIPYNSNLKKEYFEFLRRNSIVGQIGRILLPIVQKINNYIYWKNPEQYFQQYSKHPIKYYIGRVFLKITGNTIRISPFWLFLDGSLYCFCVNKTADDYQVALRKLE